MRPGTGSAQRFSRPCHKPSVGAKCKAESIPKQRRNGTTTDRVLQGSPFQFWNRFPSMIWLFSSIKPARVYLIRAARIVREFDQCIGTNLSNYHPKVLSVAIARTRSQAPQDTCRTRTNSFTSVPTATNPPSSTESRSFPGRYLADRLDIFLSTSQACIRKPERALVRGHLRPVCCCAENFS